MRKVAKAKRDNGQAWLKVEKVLQRRKQRSVVSQNNDKLKTVSRARRTLPHPPPQPPHLLLHADVGEDAVEQ